MAKILIAEDEMLIAMMLSDMLESMGHSIAARTRTGRETIDAVKENDIDLVMLDISMEYEQDGIDACRTIKDEKPQTKVLFMTAYPEGAFARLLRDIRYDGYIEKPARLTTIQQKLQDLEI